MRTIHVDASKQYDVLVGSGLLDRVGELTAAVVQPCRAAILTDDTVDALFDQVKNDLIALIREDSANGEQAMDLLMVGKYLERIGDHATNVAEWVVFSITGQHKNERVL